MYGILKINTIVSDIREFSSLHSVSEFGLKSLLPYQELDFKI